jgi:hypothetical protein
MKIHSNYIPVKNDKLHEQIIKGETDKDADTVILGSTYEKPDFLSIPMTLKKADHPSEVKPGPLFSAIGKGALLGGLIGGAGWAAVETGNIWGFLGVMGLTVAAGIADGVRKGEDVPTVLTKGLICGTGAWIGSIGGPYTTMMMAICGGVNGGVYGLMVNEANKENKTKTA